MPGPSPGPGPRLSAGKRRALIAAPAIGSLASAVSSVLMTRHPAGFQYLAVGLIAVGYATFGYVAWPRDGGRGGGLSGRGRVDDHGPVGRPAARWRALCLVSRLMPRSAGRRWLAEADSLLSEMAAARRGAAIRSYLLSAPRLVMIMWAREVSRRARLGPRRPG
jgi:hypothetical protein